MLPINQPTRFVSDGGRRRFNTRQIPNCVGDLRGVHLLRLVHYLYVCSEVCESSPFADGAGVHSSVCVYGQVGQGLSL